jgi:carotenoid cleavage dioxygenase-like enzyme
LGAGVIPYIHDFSMTENYAVLAIWPVRIDTDKMVTSNRGFLRELEWKPELGTQIYTFDINKVRNNKKQIAIISYKF